MKLVKNVVFAVVLVSAFAVNTPAGDIQIPGFNCAPNQQNCPTPPQQPSQVKNVPTPCEDQSQPTSCTSDQQNGETADGTYDFLLYGALNALLSVF